MQVQAGRALGTEHEARQQAQADFMRRTRQPAAASDFEGQGEGPQDADRPSEWAGFIYNPYSGDLLPAEDNDEGELQDVGGQGGSDMGVAYKGQRCRFLCASAPCLMRLDDQSLICIVELLC